MSQMEPDEFDRILDKLELSRREFAKRFGLNHNQPQRYADGDAKIPQPTAILLRILYDIPELLARVPKPELKPKAPKRKSKPSNE